MSRSADERAADVRRWLDAARTLRGDEAFVHALTATTGLSPQGVRLALQEHLEVEATDAEIARLVRAAGDAPRITVILSANVFVGALRAIALARAAAPCVEVRASSREPVFVEALAARAGDSATTYHVGRDTGALERITEGEIHVYGRDETIAAVRAVARVPVRAHGAGFGIAIVSGDLDAAAEALACDVVPFDQRGCLSPRIAFVHGDAPRAEAFATLLGRRLEHWGEEIPRGDLTTEERAAAARYRDTLAFAGSIREGASFLVGVGNVATLPPTGRHVHVVPWTSDPVLVSAISPFAHWVAAIGGDTVTTDLLDGALPFARRSALGKMQKPPLDGPVDLRESAARDS